MSQFSIRVFKTLALGLILAASIHSAQAQAAHTWVSGVGDDVNPCSRTAPCKSFAGAISKTSAGGTISTVDPGDYGHVTITKAITIDGTGTLAAISARVGAATGITINDTTAGDTIILRHISLNGFGTANSTGILLTAGNVVVDDCKLTGFTTADIDLASATGTNVIQNTTISNSPLAIGIRVGPLPGGSSALLTSIKDVTVEDAMVAVQGRSGMTDVKDSLLTQNTATAISAKTSGCTVSVSGCVLSGNLTSAVASVAGAIVRLTNNDIFNNAAAINNTGIVSTTGNNRRAGNTSATTPYTPTDQPTNTITQQ